MSVSQSHGVVANRSQNPLDTDISHFHASSPYGIPYLDPPIQKPKAATAMKQLSSDSLESDAGLDVSLLNPIVMESEPIAEPIA